MSGDGSGNSDFEGTREELDRVAKNLGCLEHIFLMGAALMALLAGALVAFLLRQSLDFPFRITWAVSSLALFIIPGGLSYLRVRREARSEAEAPSTNDPGTSS